MMRRVYLVIDKLTVMSNSTPVVSKVTSFESKLTLVQHKLQLALRSSEPVVQIGEIVMQAYKSRFKSVKMPEEIPLFLAKLLNGM